MSEKNIQLQEQEIEESENKEFQGDLDSKQAEIDTQAVKDESDHHSTPMSPASKNKENANFDSVKNEQLFDESKTKPSGSQQYNTTSEAQLEAKQVDKSRNQMSTPTKSKGEQPTERVGEMQKGSFKEKVGREFQNVVQKNVTTNRVVKTISQQVNESKKVTLSSINDQHNFLTRTIAEGKKEFFLKGTTKPLIVKEVLPNTSTINKENEEYGDGTSGVPPKRTYPCLHLKNFDELNYLKVRLAEAEADRANLKLQLNSVETNVNDLRSQIHRLLLKRDSSLHHSSPINAKIENQAQTIELLKRLSAERSEREKRQFSQRHKLLERGEEMRRQTEMRESVLKERLLSEKKVKIEESIHAIKQRASVRKRKNQMANKLINVLLNTSQFGMNSRVGPAIQSNIH